MDSFSLGGTLLILPALALLIGIVSIIRNLYHPHSGFDAISRLSAVIMPGLLTAAQGVLAYDLLRNDYTLWAVYEGSSPALPFLYKLAGLWGTSRASLLFWEWLISLLALRIAARSPSKKLKNLWALLYLDILLLFLIVPTLLIANPFQRILPSPLLGNTLNPLLQNVLMLLHPPVIYIGMTGMTLPGIDILVALTLRLPGREWVDQVRREMLFAWTFLSLGIGLGGLWSFHVLGWGGYWDWDPVENASILPWLLSTACLHNLRTMKKAHTTLRTWGILTGLGSFAMILIAMFITRSGIITDSLHVFSGSTTHSLGIWIGCLIACFLAVSAYLMIKSRNMYRTQDGISPTRRETFYQLMNVLLAVMTILILMGTFYPLISTGLFGVPIIFTVSFFNRLLGPLFAVIIVLMGLCPICSRSPTALKIRPEDNFKTLGKSALCAATWVFFLRFFKLASLWPSIEMTIVVFMLTSLIQQYWRRNFSLHNKESRHKRKTWPIMMKHYRSRLGGYMAHIGFLLIALGVIASQSGTKISTQPLALHHTMVFDGYRIMLLKPTYSERKTTTATVQIQTSSTHFVLHPQVTAFPGFGPLAKPAVHNGLFRDVTAVIVPLPEDSHHISLRVIVSPLVSWIWIGISLLVGGSLMAWTDRRDTQAILNKKPGDFANFPVFYGDSRDQ